MAEFKVGGKVICVEDHSAGVVRKNEVFETLAISPPKCKCGRLQIHVGITATSRNKVCISCHAKWIDDCVEWWFDSALFLPLDDFKEVTFTQIKQEVPVGMQ